MPKKQLAVIFLLCAVLLAACAEGTADDSTAVESTADNTAEISSETDSDPFEKIRDSGEVWLSYGLAAYEEGKPVEDVITILSGNMAASKLTLYDHMFVYDAESSIPVAEALFKFIYENYGADALLDIDKRVEYKNAFLDSLGIDAEYYQQPEIEAFFASMDFDSDENYKYIITFDNASFYFEDFSDGVPAQYHGFLYYSATGLFEMIDYINSQPWRDLFNTDRQFNYYIIYDSSISVTRYATGDIYLSSLGSVLHEAVHAMGITSENNDNLWLSEGICDYLGSHLGFNELIASQYIQNLTMAAQGYLDEAAKADEASAKYVAFLKKVYNDYTEHGGSMESAYEFDYDIYSDANARAGLELDGYNTLGDTYEAINRTECDKVGSELSYEQAASLINYLADTYGFDKVIDAYRTQDITVSLGKPYDELKADWLEYLND